MIRDNFILIEECDSLLNDLVAHYTELYRTKQKPEYLAEAKKFAVLARDSSIFGSVHTMQKTIEKYRGLLKESIRLSEQSDLRL